MPCLDAAAIDALARGSLPAADEADAMAHLGTCERCSALVTRALERVKVSSASDRSEEPTQQPLEASDGRTAALPLGVVIKERYQIVRRLGAGGAGEVFEVRHLHLPKRFALKVLHADVDLSAKVLLRFRREARVLADLEHPNVVRVIDFDFFLGRPFFVMEFVEGPDLGALIAARRPAPAAAKAIARQLCAALIEIHARGIIHRDLKPQNIVVTGAEGDEPIVKLIDFGLSRSRQRNTVLTSSGAVIGTPLYMSPEQAEGRSEEIDVASDQFSLAAICYELLAGHPAFRAETLAATIHKVVNEAPAPLDAGEVSPAVERILQRALSKRIDRRFGSVAEFWSALELAWDVSSGCATSGKIANRRAWWVAAGVLVVAAAGGLVGATRAVRHPPAGLSSSSGGEPGVAPASVAGRTDVAKPARVEPVTARPDAGASPDDATDGSRGKRRLAPVSRRAAKLFEHL